MAKRNQYTGSLKKLAVSKDPLKRYGVGHGKKRKVSPDPLIPEKLKEQHDESRRSLYEELGRPEPPRELVFPCTCGRAHGIPLMPCEVPVRMVIEECPLHTVVEVHQGKAMIVGQAVREPGREPEPEPRTAWGRAAFEAIMGAKGIEVESPMKRVVFLTYCAIPGGREDMERVRAEADKAGVLVILVPYSANSPAPPRFLEIER